MSRDAIYQERHRDILRRRQIRQEMMKLKDEPDPRITKTGQFHPARSRNIEFAQLDLSVVRRIQAADEVKQSRFASARWAQDTDHLARTNRQ